MLSVQVYFMLSIYKLYIHEAPVQYTIICAYVVTPFLSKVL